MFTTLISQSTKTLINKEVVEYVHPKGVSVEAEVGTVGGTEDGVTGVNQLR